MGPHGAIPIICWGPLSPRKAHSPNKGLTLWVPGALSIRAEAGAQGRVRLA